MDALTPSGLQLYGEWIIYRLIDEPRYVTIISVFFGFFCGAFGITLHLKDGGRLLSAIALSLIFLGISTPLFPWWTLILWLAVR